MVKTSHHVAVVDDDQPVLKALGRLLRGRSFDARTYSSAQAFLAALPGELPDCLIADLQMPEMTGLELHQHLTRKGFRIPTIIITAYGGSEVKERCVAAGAAAFLSKPLQVPLLFAALDDAIKGEPGSNQ